jgi:DNA-binding NtrC family response regulator
MEKIGRILIAEDERELLDSLADALQDTVEEVVCCLDGEAAFQVLADRKIPFDAILSDINMPKINGIQLLQKIRATGNEVPYVILTGHGDKDLAVQALKLGAFDFLDKPCKTVKVVETMQRAVELGREINKWSGEEAIKEALKDVSAEKNEESTTRFLRAMGQVVRGVLQKRKPK